jgi:tryptophan-rich sensory protein
VRARTLIPTTVAVAATGVVGGLASRPAASPWHRSLRKPPYQPPPQAFPIVAAGVLAGSGADLSRRAVAAEGKRAAPIALYPLWCAFATLLSGHVWFLNRR